MASNFKLFKLYSMGSDFKRFKMYSMGSNFNIFYNANCYKAR